MSTMRCCLLNPRLKHLQASLQWLLLLLMQLQQANHLQLPHKGLGEGTGVRRERGTAVTDTALVTE